jgi:3-isopropylmalate dehydratase small subunit
LGASREAATTATIAGVTAPRRVIISVLYGEAFCRNAQQQRFVRLLLNSLKDQTCER